MHARSAVGPIEPFPEETNRVSGQVVDATYSVHSHLGPGLIENVYEQMPCSRTLEEEDAFRASTDAANSI